MDEIDPWKKAIATRSNYYRNVIPRNDYVGPVDSTGSWSIAAKIVDKTADRARLTRDNIERYRKDSERHEITIGDVAGSNPDWTMPTIGRYADTFDADRRVRGVYWNNQSCVNDRFVAEYGLPASGKRPLSRQMPDHSPLTN